MSGGAFEYYCFRIADFASELKFKIEQNNKKDRHGDSYNFSPELIKKLSEYQKMIEKCANIAYEIEWLYSGDTSEDSFTERVAKYNNNE